MPPAETNFESSSIPALTVRVGPPAAPAQYRFQKSFRIGRVEPCEVCIIDDHVSRIHAAVEFGSGHWVIRDLNSSNGIFSAGERVASVAISDGAIVKLGILGPQLSFQLEPAPVRKAVAEQPDVNAYVDRYFKKPSANESFGDHTMLVRKAFAQVQTKQRSRYWIVIVALLALAGVGAGIAYREHRTAAQERETAENLFYGMKSLDVDIARIQQLVADSNSEKGREEVKNFETRRREMQANYDRFLANMHLYDRKLDQREQLILRVARIFGECELAAPPQFIAEVNNYIQKWQSSSRFKNAIALANEKGYTKRIADEFLAQDLPPQFFYLGLQESDFDQYTTGPMTRMGYAKGMWQFIPETAIKYGLHIGPLKDFARPDPGDDRHHWDLETKAAARYIKDLYGTDAQASGLLVAACYNWGEGRVLPLVQSMPLNPRERNFWRLLALYRDKIPQETYDYVFYITSAAVIGENPRLFGFDFDNPLAGPVSTRSPHP